LALVFELDFFVVQPAGEHHAAVDGQELGPAETARLYLLENLAIGRSRRVFRCAATASFGRCRLSPAGDDRVHPSRNYSIRPRWYMLDLHEHRDRSTPSMGRNCTRKSDRDALAEDRDGRA